MRKSSSHGSRTQLPPGGPRPPGGPSLSAEYAKAGTSVAERRPSAELNAGTLPIGKVAKLFGITSRAIRHYELKGLVRSERDKSNQRVFDEQARSCLEVISLLRFGGVSLSDISQVVLAVEGGRWPGSLAADVLKRRSETLEGELERVRRIEARLAELQNL